jgi:hypothetical protein
MWIFLNDAFLSIVADRDDKTHLLVRARVAGDIERVFPDATVSHTPRADYAYRASLPRKVVAQVIAGRVEEIAYQNFKNSVRDHARHDAYMSVWGVMHRYQAHERAQ